MKKLLFGLVTSIALLCLCVSSNAQSAPIGVANGTPHAAVMSWTPGAPVTGVTVAGFNVYRSTTSGGEAGTSAINGTSLVSGTTYTDSSVTPGTTYFYVVSAQATGGNQSKFSNEVSATIPQNPSAPTLTITSVTENFSGKTETVAAAFQDAPTVQDYWMFFDAQKLLAKGTAIGGGSASWSGSKSQGPLIFFAVCDVSDHCQVQPAVINTASLH